MPAPIVVPFNFEPVNTVAGSSSYTVPAGRYARVIVNASGYAEVSSLGGTPNSAGLGGTPNNFNQSIELWLKAGDVLNFSATSASGTTGIVVGGEVNSRTSVTITVNGVAIAVFYASVLAFHQNTGTGTSSSSVTGGTAFRYFSSEFNVIS